MPQGTYKCLGQKIPCRIVVSIEYHTTPCTDVGTHGERLLDHRPTSTTFLACELWGYSNDRDRMHPSIGFDPADERSPSCIMNALGKVTMLDHVAYLKVLIGNQIVR